MIASTTLVIYVLLTSSVLAAPVRRAVSATDILVFQFAGVLEKLETDFYTQALAKFQDSDFTAAGFGDVEVPEEIFTVILADESAHSSIIDSTLVAQGAEPLSSTCSFDFGDALQDVTTMAATARVIENVGVSAYLGGANLLDDKELLVAAATILTVEARHQSLLNILNAATSIPASFDMALSPSQVLAIAGGFITGCDLGIPPLPSLSVTNTGTITPGTSLSFSSAALNSSVDQSTLTCQMMTGGAAFALALPLSDCVVPDINGPVYIFIVEGNQPLLSDLTDQFAASILAGPLLTFIDSEPEELGKVVKAASGTVASSTVVSAAQATALAQAASAQNTTAGSASSAQAVEVLGWSNTTST